MISKIARELLIGIYHEVSAVAAMGKNGEILCVRLFDTQFGEAPVQTGEEAAEICLMTNHPEGDDRLYEKDRENAERIRAYAPHVPVRVFVTGEDIGVKEVKL